MAWNKKKKGWTNSGCLKKGQHNSLKTEFKKGWKHSKEWKQMMKEKMEGENNPSKRLDVKRKISEAKKGVPLLNYRGEKSSSWIDGRTPENERIRKSLEMKLWKCACLKRDEFTDQKTGQQGGKLVVHHINNFADFPELRTTISNGITLLKETHEEFHKIYGKKNNTKEQLDKFLNQKIKL